MQAKYWKRILTGFLICVLVAFTAVVSFAEEGGEAGEPAEAETTVPDGGDQVSAVPEPATDDTPASAPVVPATETPAPATAAPATAAPAPTQSAPVNVVMYVYTADDHPAAGYTVYIDESYLTADSQGMVTFPGVNIGQHSVTIVSRDGTRCTGRLYMSRGTATVLTDQAMGGTYGMNIAEGEDNIYMVVTFDPDGPLLIRALSNDPPALPEPPEEAASVAPSEIQYPSKQVVATFLDQDDVPISGLSVAVSGEGREQQAVTTDNAGRAGFDDVSYGTYTVAVSGGSLTQGTQFSLVIEPAAETGISQNAGATYVVRSSVSAQKLYLRFRQVGNTFILTDASDTQIGGITPMMLGVIIVTAIAAAIIVLVVVSKRKKKAQVRTRPTVKTNIPTGQTTSGQTTPEDYYARRIHEDDDVLSDPEASQKTGGANKFDDRSKL